MATLRSLADQVLNQIDDTVTDAIIVSWFNQAQDDMLPYLKREEYAETTIDITVNNPSVVSLPTDFYEMVQAILEGAIIDPLDLRTARTRNDSTSGYYLWGNLFRVYPVPTLNSTLAMYYYAKPTTLGSTMTYDVVDVPSQYQYLLVLYACAMSQLRDEELDEDNVYYQKYLAGKRQLAREHGKRQASHQDIRFWPRSDQYASYGA